MLIEQKRPSAVRIFQPRIYSAPGGVRQGLGRGEAHQQKLVLTGALKLDRRDTGPFDSWSRHHAAVAAEENSVMVSERFHHLLGQSIAINPMTVRKDRDAVGKELRLTVERDQADIQKTQQDRVTRVTMKDAADIGPAAVNDAVYRSL